MINFFNDYTEEQAFDMPNPSGPELPSTSAFKAAGMGFMKGAVDIAGAGVLALGGLYGFGEEDRKKQDSIFKFYEDVVQPAKDYWTPDPESVSMSGRLLGAIGSLGVPLMLGPGAAPALIGSSTFSTSTDLFDAGVDAETATGIGIMSGITTGAMVTLPTAGKTLAQTLALITSNPVLGGAQAAAQAEILKAKGYEEQAKSFNPYDPEARFIDLVLGGVFGGMAHYARVREAMPVQYNDAIDTATLAQKSFKESPFAETRNIGKHNEALNKAVEDIAEGRPVDVAPVIEDLKPEDLKKAGIDTETAKVKEAGDIELKTSEEEAVKIIEGPKEPEKGDFGPVFTQFKDKPQEAVKHLLEVKTGEAVGALHHDSIGPIDLVWGKAGTPEKDYEDGYGLAKIAQKHPEILDENLQDILSPMIIRSKLAHRISLESPDHRAAVKLEWEGKEKRWLVTAFKKKGPSHTEGLPDVSGNKGGAPPAPQDGLKSNIKRTAEKVNTASKGWKKKEKFNPEKDTLAGFVRKKGGVNVKDTYMGQEFRDIERLDLLNNKNGMKPDDLRDLANQYGFGPYETVDDFLKDLSADAFAKKGKGAVWSNAKQSFEADSIELQADRMLEEYGDIQIQTGTDESGNPVMMSARELLESARIDLYKAESLDQLYGMASDCLGRG